MDRDSKKGLVESIARTAARMNFERAENEGIEKQIIKGEIKMKNIPKTNYDLFFNIFRKEQY